MGYYKLRNVPPYTSIAIAEWLRKRGKAIRPELTRAELDELEECFTMIDADGSGAIDVDELYKAFKMLQLKVTRSKIKKMLAAGTQAQNAHAFAHRADSMCLYACLRWAQEHGVLEIW